MIDLNDYSIGTMGGDDYNRHIRILFLTQKRDDGIIWAGIDWWLAGLRGEWRGLYLPCGLIGE